MMVKKFIEELDYKNIYKSLTKTNTSFMYSSKFKTKQFLGFKFGIFITSNMAGLKKASVLFHTMSGRMTHSRVIHNIKLNVSELSQKLHNDQLFKKTMTSKQNINNSIQNLQTSLKNIQN